jgi:hypothetical protein
MSVDSFPTTPTRNVQRGDTPDLNDGLVSRVIPTASTIPRGAACYNANGDIVIASTANDASGFSPFVPVESVDNQSGGDLPISGVTAGQKVALGVITDQQLNPGDYVKPSDTTVNSEAGFVTGWDNADPLELRYARYLGREAGLLERDPNTPYGETLTVGVVPDQPILTTEDNGTVGWFQLTEGIGSV